MIPPPPPPPPKQKLPPPPPKTKVKMKIAPYFDRLDLMGEIFIHTDTSEPLKVSARRLVDTIVADGHFHELSPISVWYTYRHHPELRYRQQ